MQHALLQLLQLAATRPAAGQPCWCLAVLERVTFFDRHTCEVALIACVAASRQHSELPVSHLGHTCRCCRSKACFDMAAAWEGRCRKWYGDRYDFRTNLVDWDYHMRLAQRGTPFMDPAAGSIIHFYHFRCAALWGKLQDSERLSAGSRFLHAWRATPQPSSSAGPAGRPRHLSTPTMCSQALWC